MFYFSFMYNNKPQSTKKSINKVIIRNMSEVFFFLIMNCFNPKAKVIMIVCDNVFFFASLYNNSQNFFL